MATFDLQSLPCSKLNGTRSRLAVLKMLRTQRWSSAVNVVMLGNITISKQIKITLFGSLGFPFHLCKNCKHIGILQKHNTTEMLQDHKWPTSGTGTSLVVFLYLGERYKILFAKY